MSKSPQTARRGGKRSSSTARPSLPSGGRRRSAFASNGTNARRRGCVSPKCAATAPARTASGAAASGGGGARPDRRLRSWRRRPGRRRRRRRERKRWLFGLGTGGLAATAPLDALFRRQQRRRQRRPARWGGRSDSPAAVPAATPRETGAAASSTSARLCRRCRIAPRVHGGAGGSSSSGMGRWTRGRRRGRLDLTAPGAGGAAVSAAEPGRSQRRLRRGRRRRGRPHLRILRQRRRRDRLTKVPAPLARHRADESSTLHDRRGSITPRVNNNPFDQTEGSAHGLRRENHVLHCDGKPVAQKPTPNVGGVLKPSLLIMHYTASQSAKGAISWLCNPNAKASAHLVIDLDGAVTQLCAFQSRRLARWEKRLEAPLELQRLFDRHRAHERRTVDEARQRKIRRRQRKKRARESSGDARAQVRQGRAKALDDLSRPSDLSRRRYRESALPDLRHQRIAGHDDIAPTRKRDPCPTFAME